MLMCVCVCMCMCMCVCMCMRVCMCMCKACTHASTVQVLRLAAQATDGSPLSALGMLGKTHGVPAAGTVAAGAAAPHSSSPARVAAAPAGTGGAARPLLLTVQRAVLSSWVVELQAVQALHLVVRGELVSGSAHGGAHGSAPGARAPLMLRSATQRKRGATLELNLSAMLVGEASCVEIELLHEPLPSSGAAHVLGSAQLELGRLYQSSAAQPLQYELPLYDARAMHVATLQLLSQPHAKLAHGTPPPAAVSLAAVAASGAQPAAATPPAPVAVAGGAVAGGAPGGGAVAGEVAVAAQVQLLKAELAQAQQRAEGLQRENLRLAQRSHTQQGAGLGEQGRHGAGARGGSRMEPDDWRKAELDSLERSLARLQRQTGLQASSAMPGLEIAKIEMARMVEEAAGGRGA